MSFPFKHFTFQHYVRYIRRQNKHIQHIHAFVFAGTITVVLAVILLYTRYGFWHETYHADTDLVAQDPSFNPESPSESLVSFWKEARGRFGSIGSAGATLLEGKEVYKKEE